jgi:hypothetical protein
MPGPAPATWNFDRHPGLGHPTTCHSYARKGHIAVHVDLGAPRFTRPSARGLAHSKTLRVFQESSCRAERLGLWRPSASFPRGISNCDNVNWNCYRTQCRIRDKRDSPFAVRKPFTVLLALWGADLASPSHVSFARRCWCATLCPSAWDLALEEPSRLRGLPVL